MNSTRRMVIRSIFAVAALAAVPGCSLLVSDNPAARDASADVDAPVDSSTTDALPPGVCGARPDHLLCFDFQSTDFSPSGDCAGSCPTIESSGFIESGASCAIAGGTVGNYFRDTYLDPAQNPSQLYLRAHVRLRSSVSSAFTFLRLDSAGERIAVFVQSGERMNVRTNAGEGIVSGMGVLPVNDWACLQINISRVGTTATFSAQVDGSNAIPEQDLELTTDQALPDLWLGCITQVDPPSTFDFDEVVVSTAPVPCLAPQ